MERQGCITRTRCYFVDAENRNVSGLGFRKELKRRPVKLPGLSPSPICAPPYGFVSLLSLHRLISSCILCRLAVKMAASQLVHL